MYGIFRRMLSKIGRIVLVLIHLNPEYTHTLKLYKKWINIEHAPNTNSTNWLEWGKLYLRVEIFAWNPWLLHIYFVKSNANTWCRSADAVCIYIMLNYTVLMYQFSIFHSSGSYLGWLHSPFACISNMPDWSLNLLGMIWKQSNTVIVFSLLSTSYGGQTIPFSCNWNRIWC